MPWNIGLPPAEYYDRQNPRLAEIVTAVEREPVVAIDTETTGLTVWKDVPLFWSVAFGQRRICMPAETLECFRHVFADPNKHWVLANAKYDNHILANVGLALAGKLLDTQVMHALLYDEHPHRLDYMGKHLLGWEWKDMLATWDKRAQPNVGDFILGLFEVDPQKLIEYASNDAFGTLRIYEKLRAELEYNRVHSLYKDRYRDLWDIFYKTEVPFTQVLWRCERNGVLVDDEYLNDIDVRVSKELQEIEREIVRIAGRMINPASPTQLRQYFFDELKVPPLGYTDGGKKGVRQPQTDWNFLNHYKNSVPMAKVLLEHRDLAKLLGTYARGLREHYDGHGRIHTRFNQDVARTGRLSSSEPNLQNLPNPDADVHLVRKAFIAPRGMKLIAADYNALEMRLLAAAALERDMIEIFDRGWDIHMGNASLVYGIPYEDIENAKLQKEAIETAKKKGLPPPPPLNDYQKTCLKRRGEVKTIGFGLNYGMKEGLLAQNLGCTKEEALELMKKYKARYPAVEAFYAEATEETRKTGYSYSILGRRRYLGSIRSLSDGDRWQAERQAVNMQIQGSAADVVRLAMIHLHEAKLEERFGCRMLLQVHDEVVFECPDETVEEATAEIVQWMEHPFPTDLAVALTVKASDAQNWADTK